MPLAGFWRLGAVVGIEVPPGAFGDCDPGAVLGAVPPVACADAGVERVSSAIGTIARMFVM